MAPVAPGPHPPLVEACLARCLSPASVAMEPKGSNHGAVGEATVRGYVEGHPFDRCGLAAVSDLEQPEWRGIFRHLEDVQGEFLGHEKAFRSPEYAWPRDPLHNWSRCWEYPYVFHQVRQFREANPGGLPLRSADLGSGVTFFPFAVARLGYEVLCLDTDPICRTDLSRAIPLMGAGAGRVDVRLIEGQRLPVPDGGLDLVFCVSVLEHIPDFAATLRELSRVIRPGGLLVMTIDLDLRGDQEIGVDRYKLLLRELGRSFVPRFPEACVHPADILRTQDGPYPWPIPTGMARRWFLLKQQVLKPLFGRRPRPLVPFYLAVKGFVLERRGEA